MDAIPQQLPSCREVREWLLDYLTPVPGDDWLTPEQRLAVGAHVAECPTCRKEMADLDRVISGIRELGKIKIPEDSINRMVDFVKKLEAQSRAAAEARRAEQMAAAKSSAARGWTRVFNIWDTSRVARLRLWSVGLWAGVGVAVVVAFFLPSRPRRSQRLSNLQDDIPIMRWCRHWMKVMLTFH